MQRQRPVKGGRSSLPACVEKRIWAAVDRTATRFGCSRSFVVSVALADQFDIDLDKEDRYGTRGYRHSR